MANIRQVPMIVAIAVMSALFVWVSLDAIYPGPKYEDFCRGDRFARPAPLVKEGVNCSYIQTEEEQQCYRDGGFANNTYDESGCPKFYSCDFCEKNLDVAEKVHSRNLFMILAPIGILMIIFGIYYSVDFLGSGFMFGGIMILAWGTIQYFSNMPKFMRVLVIFVELIILVWIGNKKLRDNLKKK